MDFLHQIFVFYDHNRRLNELCLVSCKEFELNQHYRFFEYSVAFCISHDLTAIQYHSNLAAHYLS